MEKIFKGVEEYLSFYEIDRRNLNEYKVEKIEEGKEETTIHIFEPELVSKTVLLIHGYFDHTGGLKNIINHFLRKGWRVVSYDLVGHGLSSGTRGMVEDFSDYVNTLQKVLATCKEWGYYPNSVIAHSTGAAICTEFLLRKQKVCFENVIFLAPLVRPTKWRYIMMASKLIPHFTTQLNRKFKRNSGDQHYLDFAKNDPLQCKYISIPWVLAMIKWNKKVETLPVSTQEIYIIQGTIDKTVDWKYNMRFLIRKFDTCQIAMIHGGRHQLMNDDETIRNCVLKRIEKFLAKE